MNYQINMVRGDTLAFGLDFENLDQDLESAFFSVKVNATDDYYIFQKSLENGIYKVADNEYIVRVAPEDTAELDAGNYNFDLQISANGEVFTIMLGIIVLEQDVTWEVSE